MQRSLVRRRYKTVRVYHETHERAKKFSEKYNVELIKVFDLAIRLLEKVDEVEGWPSRG